MLFSSKKKKTAKAIQLAIKDIVSDGNLAISCQDISGNDRAAAFLYTELMIQEIHAVVFVVNMEFSRYYKWANLDFVEENIEKGIRLGLGKSDFHPIAMKGLYRLMDIEGSGPERINKLYDSSAQLVLDLDQSLNSDELIAFIDDKIKYFMSGLNKYF